MEHAVPQTVDRVVIRFAGDSGDGIQLTGDQFTRTTALAGNDLATLPDFPAEIRAPAGTREGVSAFQLHFSSQDIFTPGDISDVLVAMNPAALVTNLGALRKGGLIVANADKFTERDLKTAQMTSNPLTDGSLSDYRVVAAPISVATRNAVAEFGLNAKDVERTKNFFALGLMYWLYNRDPEPTRVWARTKFKSPHLEANLAALDAGIHYADTVELFQGSFKVPATTALPSGKYRFVMGNTALAMGLATAATKSGLTVFYGSYPITPASDILHALAPYKNYGVATFQAEDEIAAVCAAIGASWAGSLGVCGTSGPGLALKGEAIALAVSAELPLVVIDVQRAGPSTGMPTKTEQSDLMQALYGRAGETPVPVLAPATPSECFDLAIEAARIAVTYMTPVLLLSDGYVANGAEPWKLPDLDAIPEFKPVFRTDPEGFTPFLRDPQTLARPWVRPGTPGLEHRIGGIEKADVTGNISYDPANHERMSQLRAEKILRVRQLIPPSKVYGAESGLLLVGWGSTYGAIHAAVEKALAEGKAVAHVHLRHLNPLPGDLGDILNRYDQVLVPEMNMGQLSRVLRAEYLVDAVPLTKIRGVPFTTAEIKTRIDQMTRSDA